MVTTRQNNNVLNYKNFGLSISEEFKLRILEAVKMRKPEGNKEAKNNILLDLVSSRGFIRSAVENVRAGIDLMRRTYDELIKGLLYEGFEVISVDATLESKMLIGIGSGSLYNVFEVGLSWDYIYDLPYIPASAIKGAMRSWAIRKCVENNKDLQDRRRCFEGVLDLFGSCIGVIPSIDENTWFKDQEVFGGIPKSKLAFMGNLFVADSYPISKGRGLIGYGLLEPDIMTPHYYSRGKVVRDEFEVSPNPLPYLSIAPGTRFRFIIGVRSRRANKEFINDFSTRLFNKEISSLSILVAMILATTLREGLGAKTAKGYGCFRVDKAQIRFPPSLTQFFNRGKYVWGVKD